MDTILIILTIIGCITAIVKNYMIYKLGNTAMSK